MSMRTRPFGERGVPTRRWRGVRAALLVPGLFLCAQARANPPEARRQIASSSFTHQGAIPAKYTCEGPDTSPPLAWSGVPPSAKSLALIVDDPDAPDPKAPKTTWVHWVLYDVPSGTSSLAEGASRSLPSGTRDGLNDWRRTGYGGPCPPIGRHRYFFKLYALDIVLPDLSKPSKAELLKAMEGHVVGTAELVGTYQKGQK